MLFVHSELHLLRQKLSLNEDELTVQSYIKCFVFFFYLFSCADFVLHPSHHRQRVHPLCSRRSLRCCVSE